MNFNILGNRIPFSLLEYKLLGACDSIRSDVETRASAPISGNLWIYGQFNEVQLSVAAYQGQAITYTQLAHILDGLTRFMVDSDHPESRNVAYDILLNGRNKIGYGLVWYEPFTIEGAAANATSLGGNSLQVSPSLLNASRTTGANNEPTWVPIRRTSMSLFINYFGDPLPPSEVEEVFSAMSLEIIDHIIPFPDWPLPVDRVIYDKSNMHISVIGDNGRTIIWLQLFQILQGLYAFVSGLTPYSPHYQTLRYDIWLNSSAQFGTGSMWYDPPNAAVS